MKYQLVADIYNGLFADSESVIIKESNSLEDIWGAFHDAVTEYSKMHKRGEFKECHLIVIPLSDEGNDIWPELSEEEQSRLSPLEHTIE